MAYLKPLPQTTILNQPFWDGLRQHEFRMPRCTNCGNYHWIPYPACKTCQSEDLEWVTVSGEAQVWSYSVVHRGPGPFNDEVPYIVVLAKMAEEPRSCIVTANLTGVDPADVRIGMPIKVVYQDLPDDDITMFGFARA